MSIRSSVSAMAVALLLSGNAHATTIGNVDTLDPAVLHGGTVSAGYAIPWVSGGGLTGVADGTNWFGTGETLAQSLSAADHHWAQYGTPAVGGAIWFSSGIVTDSVLAVPAIDHGWNATNTNEGFEPFEFKVFGCSILGDAGSCFEGIITDVYARGIDDTGTNKNADDWTSRWYFGGGFYSFFMVTDGDRLVNGPFSPGEGEIDALMVVPEPNILALVATALLGLLGFSVMRRRTEA